MLPHTLSLPLPSHTHSAETEIYTIPTPANLARLLPHNTYILYPRLSSLPRMQGQMPRSPVRRGSLLLWRVVGGVSDVPVAVGQGLDEGLGVVEGVGGRGGGDEGGGGTGGGEGGGGLGCGGGGQRCGV